jgi:hypothetical protein
MSNPAVAEPRALGLGTRPDDPAPAPLPSLNHSCNAAAAQPPVSRARVRSTRPRLAGSVAGASS